MRRLVVSTMISLDGVMQAPGAPEEDPTGGFTLGGWTVNYWGDDMGDSMMGLDGKDRDLVLGLNTYAPAGDVQSGSFAPPQPSSKEIERRAKMAREAR